MLDFEKQTPATQFELSHHAAKLFEWSNHDVGLAAQALMAAVFAHRVAQSCFTDSETISHCEDSLEAIMAVVDYADHDIAILERALAQYENAGVEQETAS
jgi:hypothetical protein